MSASTPKIKILTGLSVVLAVALAVALIGMVLMLKIKGLSDDTSVAGIFTILAAISTIFLYVLLKHLRPRKKDDRSPLYRQSDTVVGKYSADKDDISV